MAKPQHGTSRPDAGERDAAAPLRTVRGKAPAEGPLALDRLIHERLRLGILSALAVNESLTFNDLKKLMQTTDGNLSVHARKLEEAGLHRVHQVVRGPRAEDGVHDHAAGSPRARALSRSHGSAHSRDARALTVPPSQSSSYS